MFHGLILSTNFLFTSIRFVKGGNISFFNILWSSIRICGATNPLPATTSTAGVSNFLTPEDCLLCKVQFTISPFKGLGLLRYHARLFVEFPYNNLAEVLQRQEKYEMAEEMHRRVLEEREKALGLEHPFTLASVNNLVGDRGKYEAAEDMGRRAWKEERRCWGSSIQNLAEVLQGQGKYELAGETHRRALEGYENNVNSRLRRRRYLPNKPRHSLRESKSKCTARGSQL
jgi:tetratricopeptide (TPR) repeat protein